MSWKNFIPHFHTYEVVAVNHYYDTSYNGHAASTMISKRCTFCGDISFKGLYNVGFLTLETFAPTRSRSKINVIKKGNVLSWPKKPKTE